GRDGERLEERSVVAAWLEPGFGEDARDVLPGALGARRSRAAAVHLGRRERLDLVEEPGRRRQRRIGGEGRGDGENDEGMGKRPAERLRCHASILPADRGASRAVTCDRGLRYRGDRAGA